MTFTATATPATGSFDNGGTVQSVVGGANFGLPQPFSGGHAAIQDSDLAAGSRTITAIYSGDANVAASTTGIITTVAGDGTFGYSGDGG